MHALAMDSRSSISVIVLSIAFISSFMASPASVEGIGVCYGRIGDNLPSAAEVVDLYRSSNIGAMRIYSPDHDVLDALRGSNIQLLVDVPTDNALLSSLASDPSAASSWVQTNILPYWPDVSFRYVSVGNEVIPERGDLAPLILPAMQNVQAALSNNGLQDQIKVSTALSARMLGKSFPPSSGEFSGDGQPYLSQIAQFLSQNGAPFLFNVYPYFAYKGNPSQISLPYALFTSPGVVVQDEQFGYQNLFDAMVDAAYAALERAGAAGVRIVVSESGWPSDGDFGASVDNARTYNQNLIDHVGQGTPRRAGSAIESFVFAMFNENQKQGAASEQHFGLFFPDKQPVYPINFH